MALQLTKCYFSSSSENKIESAYDEMLLSTLHGWLLMNVVRSGSKTADVAASSDAFLKFLP